MGNSKSKSKRKADNSNDPNDLEHHKTNGKNKPNNNNDDDGSHYIAHEKLDDENDEYLQKVQERNFVSERDMSIPHPNHESNRSMGTTATVNSSSKKNKKNKKKKKKKKGIFGSNNKHKNNTSVATAATTNHRNSSGVLTRTALLEQAEQNTVKGVTSTSSSIQPKYTDGTTSSNGTQPLLLMQTDSDGVGGGVPNGGMIIPPPSPSKSIMTSSSQPISPLRNKPRDAPPKKNPNQSRAAVVAAKNTKLRQNANGSSSGHHHTNYSTNGPHQSGGARGYMNNGKSKIGETATNFFEPPEDEEESIVSTSLHSHPNNYESSELESIASSSVFPDNKSIKSNFTSAISSSTSIKEQEALFEESLSKALIYTEISRNAKITCLAWWSDANDSSSVISPSPSTSVQDRNHQWKQQQQAMNEFPTSFGGESSTSAEDVDLKSSCIAIGTEDGFVSIVDVNPSKLPPTSIEANFDTMMMPSSSNNHHKKNNTNTSNNHKIIRELPPREGKIRSVAWSPTNPSILAIAGDDCTAFTTDVQSCTILHELEREDRIYSIKYSPNGEYMALGGFDGMISICRGDTLELLLEIPRVGLVLSLHWSYCGGYLAVGGSDRTAAIISVENGYGSGVYNNSSSGNGITTNNVVMTEHDYSILGEIQRGGSVQCVRWKDTTTMRNSACVTTAESVESAHDDPDTILAVGGNDGMVAIIDVPTRTILHEISLVDITSSPTASISSKKSKHTTRASNSADKDNHKEKTIRINDISWSPDGSFIAICGSNGTAVIVETNTYCVVQKLSRYTISNVTSIHWQPYIGKYLAVGGDDSKVAIIKTGGISSIVVNNNHNGGGLHGDGVSVMTGDESHHHHSNGHHNHTNSANGDEISVTLSTSSSMFSVQPEWTLSEDFADVEDHPPQKPSPQQQRYQPDQHQQPTYQQQRIHHVQDKVNCVAFSKGSEYLGICGQDGRVTIVTTNDWKLIHEMKLSHPITTLAWSQTNTYLAIGDTSSTASILTVPITTSTSSPNQNFPLVYQEHRTTPISTLSWSTSDKVLGIATTDGVLALLDTFPSKKQHSSNNNTNKHFSILGEMDTSDCSIHCMDWSKNGKYLAIGRSDGSVSLHSTNAVYGNFFVPLMELQRSSHTVNSVEFGVGGKFLAVGDSEGVVGVYRGGKNNASGGVSVGFAGSGDCHWMLCHELRVDGCVNCVGWSEDGRFLAMGGKDVTKGGTVVDTISWDEVEELTTNTNGGVGIGEETTSLSWSDDGKYLAVASTSGIARIVDVDNWNILQSVDRRHGGNHITNSTAANETTPPLPTSAATPPPPTMEQETDTTNGIQNSFHSINNNNADGTIKSSNETLHRFIEICDVFLAPYEFKDPPTIIQNFAEAILMLQWHVRWFTDIQDANVKQSFYTKDDGELLFALCRVLSNAIVIMEEVLEDEDGVTDWWEDKPKFSLSSRDVRRLSAWNAWCRNYEFNRDKHETPRDDDDSDEDDEVPLLDLEFMREVDGKTNRTANANSGAGDSGSGDILDNSSATDATLRIHNVNPKNGPTTTTHATTTTHHHRNGSGGIGIGNRDDFVGSELQNITNRRPIVEHPGDFHHHGHFSASSSSSEQQQRGGERSMLHPNYEYKPQDPNNTNNSHYNSMASDPQTPLPKTFMDPSSQQQQKKIYGFLGGSRDEFQHNTGRTSSVDSLGEFSDVTSSDVFDSESR